MNSKKVPTTVVETPIVVTTENQAPIEVTAVETTPVTQALVDGTYTIATDKSTAQWEGNKTLIEWKDTGTLGIKSGSFIITNGALSEGSLVFDMNSLRGLTTGKKSGEDMLEKHLKSKDFFDVEKYPTAELKMKEAATGATSGKYTVKGDLTIKGVTNAVELPVTISTVDKTMTIDSIVTLDRTKWNIRYGSGQFFKDLANNVIADNFNVALKIVAELK
jgi:polyisoprenoid-binding protein YceI